MRVLADTSVWVEHFRAHDALLAGLLLEERVVCHPLVIGELAWGLMAQRDRVLQLLRGLPRAPGAQEDEVEALLQRYGITPDAIGAVGAHLLASVQLTEDVVLWTWDPDLHAVADALNLAFVTEAGVTEGGA